MRHFSKGLSVIALATAVASVANAAPYASNVQISGTSGSFTLNEAADTVTIKYNNGTSQVISAPAAGTIAFALPTASSTFSITVAKVSGAGYTTVGAAPNGTTFGAATTLQISNDGNADALFGSTRGIAVNTNPNAGAAFGRVYVGNAASGAMGMYALNADMTGALSGGSRGPANGGIAFATAGNSPWRMQVGADNNVYVSDFADANGNLFRLDKNLAVPASGTSVFAGIGGPSTLPAGQNHGNPIAFAVTGTEAGGNLVVHTLDEDYATGTSKNSVLKYNIGGAIPSGGYSTAPTALINNPTINPASADMAVSSSGKIYVTQNRSNSDVFSLAIYDAGGTQIYNSRTASGVFENVTTGIVDLLRNTWSMAISPDETYLALGLINGTVDIVPLLADGTPDFAHGGILSTFPTGTTAAFRVRDLAFDAAGNLYAADDNAGKVRVFSPGGTTSYTTSFDGTSYSFGVTAVPEPASLGLLAVGAMGLIGRRRCQA